MDTAASGFELREHTADVLLHVWGESLEGLFRTAADGFYSVLGEVATSEVAEPLRIELEARDASDLLHDWLAELLFLFEARHVQVTNIEFLALTAEKLAVTAQGARLDIERSQFDAEVKAITYHGLDVERKGNRYTATVLLDL